MVARVSTLNSFLSSRNIIVQEQIHGFNLVSVMLLQTYSRNKQPFIIWSTAVIKLSAKIRHL